MTDGETVENKELNLRSDNVINYENVIPIVEEFDNIIKCKKKGTLIWHINKEFYFENSNILIGWRKCLRILEKVSQQYVSKDNS